MKKDLLTTESVILQDLPIENCTECDSSPSLFYLQVDMGSEITQLGEGRYCKACGDEALARVHSMLPDPSSADCMAQVRAAHTAGSVKDEEVS